MMSTAAFSRVLVQGLSGMCPEDRAGECRRATLFSVNTNPRHIVETRERGGRYSTPFVYFSKN